MNILHHHTPIVHARHGIIAPTRKPLPFEAYKDALMNLTPFGVVGVGETLFDSTPSLVVLFETKKDEKFFNGLIRGTTADGIPVRTKVVGKIVARGARGDNEPDTAGRVIDARKTLKKYGKALKALAPSIQKLDIIQVPVGELTPAFKQAIQVKVATPAAKQLLENLINDPLEGVKLYVDDGRRY